jgi:hypothetical protein
MLNFKSLFKTLFTPTPPTILPIPPYKDRFERLVDDFYRMDAATRARILPLLGAKDLAERIYRAVSLKFTSEL